MYVVVDVSDPTPTNQTKKIRSDKVYVHGAAQLASNVVETAKIKDANVTVAKIAVGSPGQILATSSAGAVEWGGTVYAHYQLLSDQSIPNNTPTIVNFVTKVADSHNAVTTGASWRFTAPVPGLYVMTAMLSFENSIAWGEGENAEMKLYIGGSAHLFLDRRQATPSPAIGFIMSLSGSTTLYLGTGNQINLRVFQSSGGALKISANVLNWISIYQVR
jgi:hypothetical protein